MNKKADETGLRGTIFPFKPIWSWKTVSEALTVGDARGLLCLNSGGGVVDLWREADMRGCIEKERRISFKVIQSRKKTSPFSSKTTKENSRFPWMK